MFILFLFFLFLPSSLSLPTTPIAIPSTCPIILPNPTTRIISGTTASEFTRSYLISLSDAADRFRCSGALLSSRWILTAAHCNPTRAWRVRVAVENALVGSWLEINRVVRYQGRDPDGLDAPGDIALVELKTPVTADGVRFVKVNVNASVPVAGSFARLAGYGKGALHGVADGRALQVDGPVNNRRKCERIYAGYLDISASYFLCVGYGKGGCLAEGCQGDSGGPLVVMDSSEDVVLVGVVSFGVECGMRGVPGVFVRVSSFVEWMEGVGGVFEKGGGDVVGKFAAGSEEAASEEAGVTVVELMESGVKEVDEGVSKLAFVVVCVVAGVAVIGVVFLGLILVVGRGREAEAEEEGEDKDTLQMALDLLRAVANGQVSGSVREVMEEGGNEGGVEGGDNEGGAHVEPSIAGTDDSSWATPKSHLSVFAAAAPAKSAPRPYD